MKKIYIQFLCILFLSSCKYKVDNSSPFKVAEAIYEGILRKDSTILKQVFIYQMDSLSESSVENLNFAKDYFEKNENIQLFKIDTSKNFLGHVIDIYFKKGKVFHKARTYYYRDSTNSIKLSNFYFTNLNEECEEYKNTIYQPSSGIEFKRITWRTDYFGKTFKSGTLELQNNTDADINFIKFRVKIMHGENLWNSETFLNQTVESSHQIFKGDIASIDIPGMKDYFVGFEIEKNELFFDAELIEVKPKPESSWCIELNGLQNEKMEY